MSCHFDLIPSSLYTANVEPWPLAPFCRGTRHPVEARQILEAMDYKEESAEAFFENDAWTELGLLGCSTILVLECLGFQQSVLRVHAGSFQRSLFSQVTMCYDNSIFEISCRACLVVSLQESMLLLIIID